MIAISVPEIDQQVRDELQPPCENRVAGRMTCDLPATWLVFSPCANCCDETVRMLCNSHTAYRVAGGLVVCLACATIDGCIVTRTERL